MGAGLNTLVENNIQLIWQTGKGYYQTASKQALPFSDDNIFVFDFISRMDLAYSVADVVVSRAGASSVSELCNLKMPCILVPSPNVAEDHQTKNAQAIVKQNGAILIRESELDTDFETVFSHLIADETQQKTLSENIKALAKPRATQDIVDEIVRLCPPQKI